MNIGPFSGHPSVTDRHEVSPSHNADDRYALAVLAELDSGRSHSQRTLAQGLGIALGLTNLLLRRFVRKGWVRAVQIRPNRVGYLLTPAGLREKAVRSTQAFQDRVRSYAEVKGRVSASLAAVVAGCAAPPARFVFVGANEVAEIVFICLQGSPSILVGIIAVSGEPTAFLGRATCDWAEMTGHALAGEPFDAVIVTTFEDRDEIRKRLSRAGVDSAHIVWL